MKALSNLGMLLFFLHWCVAFVLALICNIVKFLWKMVTQSDLEKNHISPLQATHDHVFANLYEFISNEGFALDVYTFQTSDKASLEMWRVYQKGCSFSKPYPIVLMHGLLDCSTSWFLHVDKSKCLPYILAAEGYEVWVGNNRGNKVSQKEQHPDQNFWDYNLDHLVDYDQLTIIEGVLQCTKKDKVIYVGHSQGSVQFLLGMGVHQHLHQKIAGFVGLGTVVSMKNLDHSILNVLSKFKLLQLCNLLGFKKILILPHLLTKAFGILVYNFRLYHDIVMMFVRLLCGFSSKNKISDRYFGVMLTHEPGGASSNNTLQWVQCYRNGEMRRFDYGAKKNLEVYGSQSPSPYCLNHLQKLPFKTYLFRGMKDAVITGENFDNLVKRFSPNKIQSHELHDYHHLQYLWSQTAHQDIYHQITKIVQQCSKH